MNYTTVLPSCQKNKEEHVAYQVCLHLKKLGNMDYFGLEIEGEGKYLFLSYSNLLSLLIGRFVKVYSFNNQMKSMLTADNVLTACFHFQSYMTGKFRLPN